MTDNNPGVCVTSGTVAAPHFHFVAAFKFPVMGLSVDWIEVKEMTNDHPTTPAVYVPETGSGSPSPQCASLLGISDLDNWSWVFASVEIGPGIFTYHNTTYHVRAQYWYTVMGTPPPYPPPMEVYGPYQISISVNVQNLVVTSGDVGKVLKWDPERPELCDTSFSYSITCAQKKQVQVKISIYSMEGVKVYELTEQKICPGSYNFVWDGTVNTMPPPPDGLAPEGLYTFDVEVMGPAQGYDSDWVRSKALTVKPIGVEDLGVDEETGEHFYLVRYSLIGGRNATKGNLYLYDPDLAILQSWDVLGLTCSDHNAQDGLEASSEGRQHPLLVRIPESVLKIGQYYFVLNFTDSSSDITKNHINKMTLHIGQPMTVVYQVEDTDFYATIDYLYANNLLTQDEIITIRPGDNCPPRYRLPTPADIDGDGIKDWDYPGDRKVPGTNYVVGVFGIKRGIRILWWLIRYQGCFYLFTIGSDINNNGLIEANEIQHWIGWCPFINGVNRWWIEKAVDGRWYVHCTSFDNFINPGDLTRQPGEPLRHFIYNPYENILKVYYDDGYGHKTLEYSGSPEGYWRR